MIIDEFLLEIKQQPHTVRVDEVLAIIDAYYRYTPTRFSNGGLINEAGSNETSCKIFMFAYLHRLSRENTLALFGHHYQDVLKNPQGTNHPNIRQFMQTGWPAVFFDQYALHAL